MKKLLLICLPFLAIATALPPPLPLTEVPLIFSFRYPTNELNSMHFIAYSSPIISRPVSKWRVLTNIAGENVVLSSGYRNASFIAIVPVSDHFFVLAATNSAGRVFNR